MADRDDLIKQLDNMLERIRLMSEDPDVQKRLKELAEREIDFYSFLLGLEFEKTPIEKVLFKEKVEAKAKMNWRDWVAKIFGKFNSLIMKAIGIPL